MRWPTASPSTGKTHRLSGRAKAGLVYADKGAHWWPAFSRQMAEFPHGAHDDMVDAWAEAEQLAIEGVEWAPTGEDARPRTYTIGVGGEERPGWDPFAEYNQALVVNEPRFSPKMRRQ